MTIYRVAGAENVLWTGEGAGVDIPKETHVHIWRLKALRLSSPHWEASTYQGDVIVRAESEANARRLAAKAFGIRARNGLGRELANPWYRPWLVAAEVLKGSQFDPDGEEEILYRPVPPERGEG
jgi:hypothetical protein